VTLEIHLAKAQRTRRTQRDMSNKQIRPLYLFLFIKIKIKKLKEVSQLGEFAQSLASFAIFAPWREEFRNKHLCKLTHMVTVTF